MNGEPAVHSMDARGLPARAARLGASRPADARAAITADLETFVSVHYDRLLRLAYLVCRNSADAADAVQLALELAWRRRETLRNDASLRPWLDRIVVREAGRMSKWRTSWLRRIVTSRPSPEWIEPVDPAVPDSDGLVSLRGAFARLSADHRAVVALHLHLGYSIAETAELVGAPIETVRSRLRVAKERLRREFEETSR